MGSITHPHYSPGRMWPKCFAPAVAQRIAAFWMVRRRMVGGAKLRRKTLAFLSSQIDLHTSIVREDIALPWIL